MYKFYINILLLLCCTGSMAQPVNLVPNGSFEDTIDFNNGFLAPKGWDMTLGTPDYFTALFDPPYDSRRTPQNFYGNQKPKKGKAYIGFTLKNFSQSETREYLQVKLNDTLMKDSLYNISFWVNLPDSFHWACEQKNIAIAFSDTIVESNFQVLDQISPVYFTNDSWDPSNKVGWEKISTIIKAQGNENYLIIGNFFNDNSTYSQDIGGGVKFTYTRYIYYFIDEVDLHKHYIKNTIPDTNIFSKKLVIPNVFTPNGDGIYDKWIIANDSLVKEVSIYSKWGDLIHTWEGSKGYWDGKYREKDMPEGVYFYTVVLFKKGNLQRKNGTITLIR